MKARLIGMQCFKTLPQSCSTLVLNHIDIYSHWSVADPEGFPRFLLKTPLPATDLESPSSCSHKSRELVFARQSSTRQWTTSYYLLA